MTKAVRTEGRWYRHALVIGWMGNGTNERLALRSVVWVVAWDTD